MGQRKALSAQRGFLEAVGAQMTPHHAPFYLKASYAQIWCMERLLCSLRLILLHKFAILEFGAFNDIREQLVAT
jgi:hypothetical protein